MDRAVAYAGKYGDGGLTMKKNKAAGAAPSKFNDNSTSAQRSKLLNALVQAGPVGVTTIVAREDLDVMQPAPRVFELRHWLGFDIFTAWTTSVNAQGKKHRNARCVLMSHVGVDEVSA